MSNTERKKILNYRNDNGLAPNPNNIDYGEIAIGYKKDNEAIYIKNSTNEIVDFTPTSIVSLTYAELKELRDNAKLKPSQYYRITDFVTTVANDPEAQSAGHPFDIIVMASKENKLQEECYAIQHEGDTYFANCNLAAWKIWYCLDNDSTKYAWADTTNGKGVIYRMIDEWGNDCPYDFKNVQFKRYWANGFNITQNEGELPNIILKGYYGTAFNTDIFTEGIDTNDSLFCFTFTRLNNILEGYEKGSVTQSNVLDESIQTEGFDIDKDDDKLHDPTAYNFHNRCRNNILKPTETGLLVDTKKYMALVLLNNVFITVKVVVDGYEVYQPSFDNTLGVSCVNNTFGNNCFYNSFGNGCDDISFGNNCNNNSFGNKCSVNVFGNNCFYNVFGNYCIYNVFGNNCSVNLFGNKCPFTLFGNNCTGNSFGNECSNSFGNYCDNNSFGNICQSNSFGNDCDNNSFGNYCTGNSFGNDCDNNSFGNYCTGNSFGNGCDNNSFESSCGGNKFGEGCHNNSFGNICNSNSFGMECGNNSFGNNCKKNSFGNGCYSNSFENSCDGNTFLDECGSNSFGNSCNENSFSIACSSNSFGNGCGSNSFGSSCTTNTFGDSCRGNTFGFTFQMSTLGKGVQYVKVAIGDAEYVKYVQILNGTQGTDSSNLLEINFVKGAEYSQFAGFTSDGVLKIWVEADAPHDTVDGGSY